MTAATEMSNVPEVTVDASHRRRPWLAAFRTPAGIIGLVLMAVIVVLALMSGAALSALTRALIVQRGHLDEADTVAFLAAGFDRNQILEVITGLAVSTMTNYAATVADLPLEDRLRAHAWDSIR